MTFIVPELLLYVGDIRSSLGWLFCCGFILLGTEFIVAVMKAFWGQSNFILGPY